MPDQITNTWNRINGESFGGGIPITRIPEACKEAGAQNVHKFTFTQIHEPLRLDQFQTVMRYLAKENFDRSSINPNWASDLPVVAPVPPVAPIVPRVSSTGEIVYAPNVDPSLLIKAQPYHCGLDHIDVDQHGQEFTSHVHHECGQQWQKMQNFVNGAYTDQDFSFNFKESRNKIHQLFVQVEVEGQTLCANHDNVVKQNNTLIGKAKELMSYNATLNNRLLAQRDKLSQIDALERKLRELREKAKVAGLVETKENKTNEVGKQYETGKTVVVPEKLFPNGFQQPPPQPPYGPPLPIIYDEPQPLYVQPQPNFFVQPQPNFFVQPQPFGIVPPSGLDRKETVYPPLSQKEIDKLNKK